MRMNRRGFLGSMLALGAAPAIVRAESLMRVYPASLRTPLVFGTMRIDGQLLAAEICESVSSIDVTTLLSTAKSFASSYLYEAKNVELALPPGADVRRLWADGVEVRIEGARRTARGLLLPRLDLSDYGNRVPEFAIEVVDDR